MNQQRGGGERQRASSLINPEKRMALVAFLDRFEVPNTDHGNPREGGGAFLLMDLKPRLDNLSPEDVPEFLR